MKRGALVLVTGLLFGATVGSGVSQAFMRTYNFCNKANHKVEVAYGYEPAGSTNTQTKGWRNVNSCQCVTLFSEDVRATEVYVYVRKPNTALEDSISDGRAPLCVKSGKFRAGPANKSQKRCTEWGGKWVNYLQRNAEKDVHSTNFGSGGNCRD